MPLSRCSTSRLYPCEVGVSRKASSPARACSTAEVKRITATGRAASSVMPSGSPKYSATMSR